MDAANKDDAGDQYGLGLSYYRGSAGVAQDYALAIDWFRKAADQGHAGAQYSLGSCYTLGHGVSKDPAKTVEWYGKAAEQGFAKAQYALASFYYLGRGVPQDYASAVELFQKAADQGHAGAQYLIGKCYHDGTGVPRDYTMASEWCRKAFDQGNTNAQHLLNCSENWRRYELEKSESLKRTSQAFREPDGSSSRCEDGSDSSQDDCPVGRKDPTAAELKSSDPQPREYICSQMHLSMQRGLNGAMNWLEKGLVSNQAFGNPDKKSSRCEDESHSLPGDFPASKKYRTAAAMTGNNGVSVALDSPAWQDMGAQFFPAMESSVMESTNLLNGGFGTALGESDHFQPNEKSSRYEDESHSRRRDFPVSKKYRTAAAASDLQPRQYMDAQFFPPMESEAINWFNGGGFVTALGDSHYDSYSPGRFFPFYSSGPEF